MPTTTGIGIPELAAARAAPDPRAPRQRRLTVRCGLARTTRAAAAAPSPTTSTATPTPSTVQSKDTPGSG